MNRQQRTGSGNFQNRNKGNVKNNFNRSVGQGQHDGMRPKRHRDAVIQQNLAHMQQVAHKKKLAQEKYYGNGRSPMIKTSSGPFIKQEHKFSVQDRLSVQHRLGQRGAQKFVNNNANKFVNHNANKFGNASTKKFVNANNNKFVNNNQNKRPIFINTRPNTNKVVGGMRSDKVVRVQNMMQHKKTRFNNQNGAIKTINSAGKVVYLQPVKRQPNNYTVRVNNDRKHHVNQGLNPILQQEIKMIQNKNSRQIVAPTPPVQPAQNITNSYDVDRLPIVTTNRTLHERFSSI